MTRTNVTYGLPLESQLGFARAVRIGNLVAVSGTAPRNSDGSTASPGDVHAQTKRCIEIIQDALERAGARLSDVVRTRIMLVRISDWEEAARAHAAFFVDVQPATTVVEVSGFIDPDWLVEIEADAMLQEPG